jgi:hypothetical protein
MIYYLILALEEGWQMNVLGRWDVTVQGQQGEYASWFEIIRENGELSGRFVGIQGSARPMEVITYQGNELYFHLSPQYERHKGNLIFKGKLREGLLVGETNDENDNWITFRAVPAPKLLYRNNITWGNPVNLIQNDLTNWILRNPEGPNGWKIKNRILSNTTPSVDLITKKRYTDFKIHAEYKIPEKGNSGIYLRGRYEVQIVDDDAYDLPELLSSGAIYGFLAPSTNASKPTGKWNTLDITCIGSYVTIDLNGQRVIEKQEIPGLTGGALDSREGEPGPIMLQGDHQAIEFRKLFLTPAE